MNASSLPHAQLGEPSRGKHQQTTHPCFGVRCIAGSGSLNDRLATLVASIAGAAGDRGPGRMEDFDSPSYDRRGKRRACPRAEQLRGRIEAAHAFVIVSPEYNASMPGTVKNVIDGVPSSAQPFNGKQGLLLSASPSQAGGNRGLWALRVPLEHLGARIYPDMFSLAQAHQAFDSSGRLANAALQGRLEETITCSTWWKPRRAIR